METELRAVIVRTYSAGVHFGYLRRREGKEVEMEHSRRIWRWGGAWTLNEIATTGLDVNKSKVSAPVASILLTEAIEVIECSPEAEKCLNEAKWTN